MLVTRQEKFPHDIFEGMSEGEKGIKLGYLKKDLATQALEALAKDDPHGVVEQTFEGGPRMEYTLTASVVLLTERQAYTIALSQRFSPFNADLQTLDELRQNARRYAPDLLKLLVGE